MTDKKKILLTAVITALLTAAASCFTTVYVKDKISYLIPTDDPDKAFFNKLKMLDDILDYKYLYEYDKSKLREAALEAYIDALDEPYTAYYGKDDFDSYMSNIQDGYVGIGVMVGVNDANMIEVIAPFEDSPAYNAGIQPGDLLIAVDGTEYSGDSMNDAVDVIKSGTEGSAVDLTLKRGEETLNITVERGEISSESVKGEMLDGGIAYVRITGFNMSSSDGGQSTSAEFEKKLEELTEEGMTKLIIDLRDNPGGVLTEVCPIADRLLPEGVIMYTEDKNGKRQYYNSDAEELDIPMAVLINGNSASASEVLTGALKDYDRAVVVGTTSYGKGIVQDVYTLRDGSGISLTTSKYFTPNGICIHETGITPDIIVEAKEEYKDVYASQIPYDDDTQLKKAVEILRDR